MKTWIKSMGRLGAVLAMGLLGAQAQAATISLADLLGGESIQAGDKVFSGWELLFSDASDAALDPDLSQITVSSLDDGGLDPGPGLSFAFGDELTVAGAVDLGLEYIDLMFGFWVTPAVGYEIKDVSLDLGAAFYGWDPSVETNNAGSAIVESVYAADGTTLLGDMTVEWSQLDYVHTGVLAQSLDFAPQSKVWIEKNLFVWAEDAGDRAGLNGMDQRYSQQVPEPATVLLFGLGLAGLAARRRRVAN